MCKKSINIAFILLLGFTQVSLAQDTGFLSDYSKLEADTNLGVENIQVYIHPDAFTNLSAYQAIMIDQPEISVAADSKVKSLKPDDMVQLAEAMRAVLIDKLNEDYFIVDKPGPDVLLLRVAASNLYLKKAKRGFLSYTPVGLVVHAAKSAVTDEITKKISFVEISIEAEILDSLSGEQIVAFVTQRGQRKDKKKDQKMEPSSWDEVMGILDTLGSRVDCRLDNARVAQEEWKNCVELFTEPEPEKEDS